jgi:hypothetical protein
VDAVLVEKRGVGMVFWVSVLVRSVQAISQLLCGKHFAVSFKDKVIKKVDTVCLSGKPPLLPGIFGVIL